MILILVNPASGRGRALRLARDLEARIARTGREVRLEESRGPGWMSRRAAEAQAECVVAAGGDGTVNEVASGLSGRGIPLAVLPSGTVNLLARVYGLPWDPEGLLRALEAGRTRDLDLGTSGDRVFLSCAGAGFDGHVVRTLHRERRGPIRIWGYLPPLARLLACPPETPVRAVVDGEDLGTFRQAIVGNLPLYAGVLRFTPDAEGDDGLLDVALFPGGRRRDLLRYAASAWRGASPGPDVVRRRAREIRLEASGPVPLQLDGDDAGDLPVALGVRSRALRLLVPASA